MVYVLLVTWFLHRIYLLGDARVAFSTAVVVIDKQNSLDVVDQSIFDIIRLEEAREDGPYSLDSSRGGLEQAELERVL